VTTGSSVNTRSDVTTGSTAPSRRMESAPSANPPDLC
jgi:hypothetical protein